MSHFDPALIQEVRQLAGEGRKIEAIKLIRSRRQMSLADATDALKAILQGEDPNSLLRKPLAQDGLRFGGRRRIDRTALLCLVIFLTTGLALVGTAAWLGKREHDLKQRGVAVQATVVENRRERRGFTPVFAFEWEGRERRVVSQVTSSVRGKPVYEVGETLGLRVDPADPERFSTDDWFSSWFSATLLGGIGTLLLLVGGGVSLMFLRR